MLLGNEGWNLLYSAFFWNRAGLSSHSLGVSGLEVLPGLGPHVAVDTSSFPLLLQHVAHCDRNISSLPGEKRSLQVASPYAVTAHVVFGLRMNGSVFRHDKLHPLLMLATSEKEKALRLPLQRSSEVSLRRLERVNSYLEPSCLFLT